MLRKTQRLTKEEFDRCFAAGKRIHSPIAQLIYTPSERFHGAAVVGKKVYKRAVDRNTLRRRLYAILYARYKDSLHPMTIILIAKPPLAQLTRKEAQGAVVGLLQHIPRT
jgi:ribonuclease P protein component